MSLASALRQAANGEHRGRRCHTCTLIEALPTKDRTALLAALDDQTLSTKAIWRAVEAEGYDVSENSLRRHRSGGCLGA